jgi:hypothetical protein
VRRLRARSAATLPRLPATPRVAGSRAPHPRRGRFRPREGVREPS